MSFTRQFVTKYFKVMYGTGLFIDTTYQFFMPIYHISSLLYFVLYIWGRAWYKVIYECPFTQQCTQFQQWGLRQQYLRWRSTAYWFAYCPNGIPLGLFWVRNDVGPYNHVQMSYSNDVWWAPKAASIRRQGERNIRLFAFILMTPSIGEGSLQSPMAFFLNINRLE
jgi:hypothetical protein